MGCVNSKPKVDEIETISISQLEKELFKFNNNKRCYLKRKNNYCLRKSSSCQPILKPQRSQCDAPSSCESSTVEDTESGSTQTFSNVPLDRKASYLSARGHPHNSPYQSQKIPLSNRTSLAMNSQRERCETPSSAVSVSSRNAPSKSPLTVLSIRPSLASCSFHVASKSQSSQSLIAYSYYDGFQSRESSQMTNSDILLSSVVTSKESAQGNELEWMSVLESLHLDKMYHPSRHYNIIRQIGKGSFGQVDLAAHKENQEDEYAIKTIALKDCLTKQSLVIELEVLRVCDHKNVLALKESYFTDEYLYIVTEYIAGVSLYTLCAITGCLTEKVISSIMKECLQGLSHIHDCGFIHCDIKSDNILISVDRKVKIADFGLAVKENEVRPPEFRGTLLFAAPEMANKLPYGREVDVWSLGIVAIEMAQGYPPLADIENYERLVTLSKSGYNSMNEEAASKASDDLKDFLYYGALMYNPANRLTVNDLLDHPFMLHGDNCECLPLVVDWVLQEQMLQDPD